MFLVFFFFSSRRRHTRCSRDWSSDVCSSDLSFRQVHRKDGARIQFRRVCTLDGEEVPYSDIAKGYELPTGDMVVLTDEDLADLPLVTAHRIEVLHFAPAAQVEAIYSNKSYYTEPQQ